MRRIEVTPVVGALPWRGGTRCYGRGDLCHQWPAIDKSRRSRRRIVDAPPGVAVGEIGVIAAARVPFHQKDSGLLERATDGSHLDTRRAGRCGGTRRSGRGKSDEVRFGSGTWMAESAPPPRRSASAVPQEQRCPPTTCSVAETIVLRFMFGS